MTTIKQITDQLALMTSVSIDPVDDIATLQKECDKTCETVMAFLRELIENADKYQDVLNDVSSELEELVMDENSQRLLRRLDDAINWVYEFTKEAKYV